MVELLEKIMILQERLEVADKILQRYGADAIECEGQVQEDPEDDPEPCIATVHVYDLRVRDGKILCEDCFKDG